MVTLDCRQRLCDGAIDTQDLSACGLCFVLKCNWYLIVPYREMVDWIARLQWMRCIPPHYEGQAVGAYGDWNHT